MKIVLFLLSIIVFFSSCTKQEPHMQVVVTLPSSQITLQRQNNVLQEVFTPNNSISSLKEKIAIVYAIHDIGKYSIEAINTINVYLTSKQNQYDFFVHQH